MTYILIAILTTLVTIFIAIPEAGFDIKMWVLIVSASVGGMFSGFLVLLGQSVIEDIVILLTLLVLAGVLWGTNPELGYIFISILISGGTGAIANQIYQFTPNKRM